MEKAERTSEAPREGVALGTAELRHFPRAHSRHNQQGQPRAPTHESRRVWRHQPSHPGDQKHRQRRQPPRSIQPAMAPRLRQQHQRRNAGDEEQNVIQVEHRLRGSSLNVGRWTLDVGRSARHDKQINHPNRPETMKLKVTMYLDVISSWCFWAQPAWEELKKRYAGRVAFEWKIALMDASGFPKTIEQAEWFYRRSGMMMRSPFMLKPGWFEPNIQECLAPNLVAEAARDLGV